MPDYYEYTKLPIAIDTIEVCLLAVCSFANVAHMPCAFTSTTTPLLLADIHTSRA